MAAAQDRSSHRVHCQVMDLFVSLDQNKPAGETGCSYGPISKIRNLGIARKSEYIQVQSLGNKCFFGKCEE